jgi:FkbM family methyltransferase
MNIPAGYRLERGMLWPADDLACAAVVFDTTGDLDEAYRYVRNWDLAVQAGGNMGVWPLHMAKSFETVLTFEADPRNWVALEHNVAGRVGIQAEFAALTDRSGDSVGTELPPRERHNAGAMRLSYSGSGTPTVALDDLQLEACDLIYLDIEGYELFALRGAEQTIRTHQPVVAFEDKGLSTHYGVSKGQAERFMTDLGYRVVARPHRDVIMVPA